MSEEHDHDLPSELPTDATEKLEEYDVDEPVAAVTSLVGVDPRTVLSLLGGGVLLMSALKSLAKGQMRALPKAAAAAGLFSYGLRHRVPGDEVETFQPSFDEIEGGSDEKDVSDAAASDVSQSEAGELDESGDKPDAVQEDVEGDRIEFTDDGDEEEPRTKPESVGGEEDPRRDTNDDDDEAVEIDVSDSAMAEEASEATGPDPEQAQPAQTDATEPEETPEEDASDMKVEPGEEADSTTDEDDAAEDDEE